MNTEKCVDDCCAGDRGTAHMAGPPRCVALVRFDLNTTLRRCSRCRAWLFIVVLALVAMPPAPSLAGQLPPGRIADLVETLLPTVVNISTVRYQSAETASPNAAASAPAKRASLGSGFIIDAAGIILTNKHVVDGAAEITVALNDDTTYSATLVYAASGVDIAILMVNPEKPLAPVKFGDSDKLRVGDPLLAIGNPLGFGSSVSAGIVSALDRDIRVSAYDEFIQTDAAINHGNSGGPLFNLGGEVVGVNTALVSPSNTGSVGLGFSIPSNDVKFVIERLREFGRVKAGWIGVRAQQVTKEIADSVGLLKPQGVIVTDLDAGAPGSVAGLQQGDVIVKVADRDITDVRMLARGVAVQSVGAVTPVVFWRDGTRRSLMVTIGDDPQDVHHTQNKPMAEMRHVRVDAPDMGLEMAAITDETRRKFMLSPAQNGVVVTAVVPNSSAADQGIVAGEVIVRTWHEAVTNPAQVSNALREASQQHHARVLLLIHGSEGLRWVPLPVS
jgi:serine protease Do